MSTVSWDILLTEKQLKIMTWDFVHVEVDIYSMEVVRVKCWNECLCINVWWGHTELMAADISSVIKVFLGALWLLALVPDVITVKQSTLSWKKSTETFLYFLLVSGLWRWQGGTHCDCCNTGQTSWRFTADRWEGFAVPSCQLFIWTEGNGNINLVSYFTVDSLISRTKTKSPAYSYFVNECKSVNLWQQPQKHPTKTITQDLLNPYRIDAAHFIFITCDTIYFSVGQYYCFFRAKKQKNKKTTTCISIFRFQIFAQIGFITVTYQVFYSALQNMSYLCKLWLSI